MPTCIASGPGIDWLTKAEMRDAIAHLGLGQPAFVLDKFPLHLAAERNRSAEANQAEPQEIADDVGDLPTARSGWILRGTHVRNPPAEAGQLCVSPTASRAQR